ncbi:MAG: chloride channel protein [Actinomycetes bacterium]
MTSQTLPPPASARGITARDVLAMGVSGLVGLGLGYLMLLVVNFGIELMWETIPSNWESTPLWYVYGVLVGAAVLVYVIRRYVGDDGHSPLAGIKITSLTPREYVGAILAILVSLFGGAVLGPEVALVATGSVVGGLAVRWLKASGTESAERIVRVGALGAILALFAGPLLSGSLDLGKASASVDFNAIGWAVLVSVIAAVAATIARVLGFLVARSSGSGPNLKVLVGAALIIGTVAVLMEYGTGQQVIYVVTSGEQLITELPKISSVATVVAIIIFKTIAYAVSLGSGFRGGPFFPGMFVGAASGLLISLTLPEGPTVTSAMAVGVVAAVVATAPMKWWVVIVIGVGVGFAMGGWTLIPAAVVGAVVARLIPRWGDRLKRPETLSEPNVSG